MQKVQAYLNSLSTLKARFLQRNPDGAESKGVFYLWRPGLMRLEYDPPSQELLIADGTYVHHIRKDLDEESSIAIDSTPAGILLNDTIDFQGSVEVLSFEEDTQRHQWHLALAHREDPEAAQLILSFNPDPLTLLGWIMIDAKGHITQVVLDAIESNVRFDKTLFQVQ